MREPPGAASEMEAVNREVKMHKMGKNEVEVEAEEVKYSFRSSSMMPSRPAGPRRIHGREA